MAIAREGRGLISDFDLKRPAVKVGYGLLLFGAVLLALAMLYPLVWVFFSALKGPREVYLVPPTLLPREWNWASYRQAWNAFDIPRYTLNTFVLFGGVLLSKLAVTTMAAYALSAMRLPWRRGFLFLFMSTLMVPPMAYMIPSYLVLRDVPLVHWNLLDSYWAFWLPAGADGFTIFLLKGFFDGVPKDLLEAGRIDGASELQLMTRIVLPLSKPVLATLSIFTFMGIWRDFFWPMIVLSDSRLWTVMVAVYKFVFQSRVYTVNVHLAAGLIITLPPMVVFLLFQRAIMEGARFTGLKG